MKNGGNLVLPSITGGQRWQKHLLAFTINAITELDDNYLGKWLKLQLDTTMGPCPQQETGAITQSSGYIQAQALTNATFAADIWKGVALSLKELGPIKANQMAQGPTQVGDNKAR